MNNRFTLVPRLFILLFSLILGQAASYGQYYPPAVKWGGAVLGGGGGAYSVSYSYEYMAAVVMDDGYWDYSNYGHYEVADQGYWDNTNGHYDEEGNWVVDPVWIAVPVYNWVIDPTWVYTGSTTTYVPTTAYASLSASIGSGGDVALYVSDTNPNGGSGSFYGSYDFAQGTFGGGVAPALVACNSDGSSWAPPPPPPNYPSYGPPSFWVNETHFIWVSTSFNDPYQPSSGGYDYYADGSGNQLSFQSSNPDGASNLYVWGWSGVAKNGVCEYTYGNLDVRFGDSSGNYALQNAPEGMPLAIRLDGESQVWNYLGQGGSLHYYAGPIAGKRLSIDPSTGLVSAFGNNNFALYSNGVIWNQAQGRDVRAVMLDGSLMPPTQSPSWGPAAVLVNQALWRYVGTWSDSTAAPFTPAPYAGDHYLGDNDGQRLVVNSSGTVTVFSNAAMTATGTYAPQSQDQGAPLVFNVSDYDIYPGDLGGTYYRYQPVVGPPALWVNGTTFAFANSKEQLTQLGTWVDTYVDGSNNYVAVTSSEVRAFQADGSSNWAGYFVPAGSNQADGGIFVVVSGSPRYDVRASSGTMILLPQTAPQNNHPWEVKVDGDRWKFAGSAGDTDYYFGTAPGERLWIDANGAVSFTNNIVSQDLAGQGSLSGSVFLLSGHDLRACTSNGLPVTPAGSPQWGPAALSVEGVLWSFIGSVSDDVLNIHADYYGGINAGQVVSVNSSKQVAGAYTGVYDGGVFAVGGGADLRALDGTGALIPPTGEPANGYLSTLRIGGLHWEFIGTTGGVNYYATSVPGQRLSIDATGAVVYSDHPHNINNATGTYASASGVFTSTSGGTGFNAGTIGDDLDILGNVISFGSLRDSSQTAGVTLQFMDDGTIVTMQNALARPQARWNWSRAATVGGSTALPVMQLDEQGRLNLYDPATAATPQVEPTISLAPGVQGQTTVPTSKLPKLELPQQTLDTDSSVVTKTLGDQRYLRSAGSNQSLSLSTGINVNTGSSGSANTVPADAAAIGQNLQAGSGQVVVGRNNTAASNEVFVVGAGASSTQTKNALSVSTDGNTTVAGNLSVTGATTLANTAVSGTLTVSGSPVLAQGSGSSAYLTTAQMDSRYLKSSDASGIYLTTAAAASQFVPLSSNTVSLGGAGSVAANGVGIGAAAQAGSKSIATGYWAIADGMSSIALGASTRAAGTSTVAIGDRSYATQDGGVALGVLSWSSGVNSLALGIGSLTSQHNSIAIGASANSGGEGSIALGAGSLAATDGSVAVGAGAKTFRVGQVVLGSFNETLSPLYSPSADDSIFIIGNGTADDARSNAFTIKRNGDTAVTGTLTVGGSPVLTEATAATAYATLAALTSANTALTSLTASLPDTYLQKSATSLGLGTNVTASGTDAVAFGTSTNASGDYAFALGDRTNATGSRSVALGQESGASGYSSFAAGGWSTADGDYSAAMGLWAYTAKVAAVALGGPNICAKGANSFAAGSWSTAWQDRSIALGYGLWVTQPDQIVLGRWNDSTRSDLPQNLIFVLGNGTDPATLGDMYTPNTNPNQSNAIEVELSGRTTIRNKNYQTDAAAVALNILGAASVSSTLKVANQTLDDDTSVVTRALGDARYLRSSGGGSGSFTLSGGLNIFTGSGGSNANTVASDAAAIGQNLQAASGQVVVGRNNAAASDAVFVVGAGTSAATTDTKNAISVSTGGDTTMNGNLTVSGTLSVNGSPVPTQADSDDRYYQKGQPIRMAPAGDIDMGEFKTIPANVTVPGLPPP